MSALRVASASAAGRASGEDNNRSRSPHVRERSARADHAIGLLPPHDRQRQEGGDDECRR